MYAVATARIVLSNTGVITPRGTVYGRAVLNVTDRGRKVSVTVQDTSKGSRGKALARLDAQALRSTVLLNATADQRATLNGFVR